VQKVIGHGTFIIPVLGIVGAALFYGDAVITPALSVLSAVEGLSLVTPAFDPWVIPISLAILFVLFVVQSRGTASVASWFGPIMGVWFAVLAVGGLVHIIARPEILAALSPLSGVTFLLRHGTIGFVTLGSVFLAVTGAEALYADLGHFGRGPIRIAWFALVFPALILNYLGQGALVLARPEAAENPFFLLYPESALLPMVALATVATIIASQAVITGAYSLTQQAIQLGLMPRFEIRMTSETERGQIYIPKINWMLLIAVLYVVGAFRSSSALASAYGIAVTGTMVISAVLCFFVAWKCWEWHAGAAALLIVPFLCIDGIFLSANVTKVLEGGWLPLLIGLGLTIVMVTWRRGSRLLSERTRREDVATATFLPALEARPPERVHGTAIFFTAQPENVPVALLHNIKHNKVLHDHNIILAIRTRDVPRVDDGDRSLIHKVSDAFTVIELFFGYMEEPNVPKALVACRKQGVKFDVMSTSFFLSRRSLKPAAKSKMPAWQDRLFIRLARTANDAAAYFRLPTERTVEIGSQITI
jgi:KUP system potassium uptake protein